MTAPPWPPPRSEPPPELIAPRPDLAGYLDDHLLASGLFGASDDERVVGAVRPVPAVRIGDEDVASGPAADGSWPALMVVDGLSVRWGRADVLEQPDPATARVALFDPSAVWAAGADLIGRPLTLRWSYAGSNTRTFFRGRVSSVDVRPKTVTRRDGTKVPGALVTLTGSSLLADLGNRRPAEATWPAESLADRRARLLALAAGPVQVLTTRDYWDDAPVAAAKVDDTNALAQLDELFDSCGADRHTYDPATHTLSFLQRRAFLGDAGLAHLFWDPDLRTGVFIQAMSIAQTDTPDQLSAPLFIDARAVEYADGVGKDMGSRLTRVEVGYTDTAAGEDRTLTRLVPGTDEAIVGERGATMSTLHGYLPWAEVCADDLAAFAAGEAAGWRVEPMRWDTTRTDGFETFAQADLLLCGQERFAMFFLQGSWLPTLGIRPVFGVIGGTIEYRRGGWAVEWNTAPVATADPQPAELTWDHVDAGDPYTVVWNEDDDPFGMHSSVTWEDLQYVALGFGVTTLPTDGA